jgi:hypothetical protein|tara:strand:- start:136 stop:402 length:267 start_codon:yes stop_codon:yes gene_type:complete
MTIFDLDQSITVEFHGGVDEIEKKMLGLWADERFKQANVGMRLINEHVVVMLGQRIVTEIPFALFEKLAVKELAEIIINQVKYKFNSS